MKLFKALIGMLIVIVYAFAFWLILKNTELEPKYIIPACVILAMFYSVLYDIYTNTKPKP